LSYFDCYLIPVRAEMLDTYKVFSQQLAALSREYGALRIVDCLLDPTTSDGTQFHAESVQPELQSSALRDFPIAAATEPGETVILSWTEWPSKEKRDDALPRLLADPRIQPQEGQEAIFEGRRLIAGGFFKLVDV